jgi:hypothetical protein
MTSNRPYKEAFSPVKAAQIMVGTHRRRTIQRRIVQNRDNRDLGMRQCFDENLLRKFIIFLGKVSSEI